jgi:hypothetical protein
MIQYMYYTGGCILIFNVLYILKGMFTSYLDLSLHVSSQTLRMSDSIFREEILYNLTNYYLYDDRFIQVPSFKGQQHIHASVLKYVSTMKCITPDFGSNIESKFAADVTREYRRTPEETHPSIRYFA